VSYLEVPRTPPLTPISPHSLPLSIQEPHQSRQRELTPRQRSHIRTSESWELTEFQRKCKVKERTGERQKISNYVTRNLSPQGMRCDEAVSVVKV
jgi:hypothetical protein